jgi:HAD superfamily hydrolase (TIGR01484 family)
MKVIASDFDGTLFQENGLGIISEDFNAIKTFRDKGGLFGIVTARDLTGSKQILQMLKGYLDFFVCSGGAITCDAFGNVTWQAKSSEVTAIYDIFEFSKPFTLESFVMINESERYVLHEIQGDNLPDAKHFNNVTIWFTSPDDATKVENYIRENYADKITFFRNIRVIEITPKNVTKETGLTKYINTLNSPTVYTVGDGVTDISMITAYNGFAVENADEKLKKVAKFKCNRVNDMIYFILNNL